MKGSVPRDGADGPGYRGQNGPTVVTASHPPHVPDETVQAYSRHAWRPSPEAMTQVEVPSQRSTVHPRCAAATSLSAACQGLVDDLHERYALPSVYLLVDGRLRCQAARGYFQVVDGFPSEPA